MSNVKIFSRTKFEEFIKENEINDSTVELFTNVGFISIVNVDRTTPYRFFFKKSHSNVLNLAFNDAAENEEHAFTEQQGMEIINFLKANSKKTAFYVHCEAGVSRSGAVGEFIINFFNWSYNKFKMDNRGLNPNMHVLRILNSLNRKLLNS